VDTTASSGTPTLTVGANGNSGSFSGVIQNTAGTLALIKSGAGTLTLSGANTYSGGTTLNAGILSVGNNSALSSGTITLNGGSVDANSTAANFSSAINNNIVVNGSAGFYCGSKDATYSGAITGSGTLNNGAGQGGASLTLSGDFSGFTGTFAYASGGNYNNINLGSSTAASMNLSHAQVVLSGSGPSGQYRTVNFGGSGATTFQVGDFSGTGGYAKISAATLAAGNLGLNSTFAGAFADNNNATIAANVTKVGTGAWTLSGASQYTGMTTVENGSLIAGAATSASTAGSFGNAATPIALGDPTTVGSATAMNPQLLIGGAYIMGRTVAVGTSGTLGNASTTFMLGDTNTTGSATFSGAITLNQSLIVTQATGGTLNITAGITSGSSGTQSVAFNNPGTVNVTAAAIGGGTGTIALTKTSNGTLTLSAANTYTGNTTISAGTLALSGSGSLTSPNISVATGANFDVSAITPAGYSVNGSGTLALNINKAGSTRTQGQLVIGAKNLTYGGALTVTASGDALANGDSFTLVSKSSGSLSEWFSTVNLPALSTGLTWDTNHLATAGSLDVYNFTTNAVQTMVALKDTATTLKISKLITKTVNERGTVTLSSVSSASGAPVSISGNDINYTPPPGVTGPDTFTAVLTDGHGSITATVVVTVSAANVVSLTGGDNGSGYYKITTSGMPGQTYNVQTQTTDANVTGSWTTISTATAEANGVIIWTDSELITAHQARIYRLAQP